MSDPGPEVHSEGLSRGILFRTRYLFLVGLGLYLVVVWWLGWQALRDAIVSVRVMPIIAVMVIEAAAEWLRALKWRLALGRGHNAVALFFLSKAMGYWSPCRVGELSPLLVRRHRTPKMGAWIIVDRFLEMGATLGLGLAGLLALQIPGKGLFLGLAVAVCILLLLLVYLVTRRQLFLWIASCQRGCWFRGRLANFLAAISEEVIQFRTSVPLSSIMTMLATVMDLCAGILLLGAFGYRVTFPMVAAAQCVHALTSAIPITPNVTGLPYVSAAVLLHQVAGIPFPVLAAVVALHIIAINIVFWTSFGVAAMGWRREVERGGTGPHMERHQAELFDRLAAGTKLYDYHGESLHRLDALVRDKGRVLDVGCGDGTIGTALDADWVVGIDVSYRCAALAAGRGLTALITDAVEGLPFRAAAFDTVYCIDVLHHLGRTWEPLFDELDRVLRPGGTLAIVEPDARNPLVRWTQAPNSPIRVAPYPHEPAIDPAELTRHVERRGYTFTCRPIEVKGDQIERSVFPLWQRLLKAPVVLALAWWFRRIPKKFAIIAQKPLDGQRTTDG